MGDKTSPRRDAKRTSLALVTDFRDLQRDTRCATGEPTIESTATVSPQTAKAFAFTATGGTDPNPL